PVFSFCTQAETNELLSHTQAQHYTAGTVIRQIGEAFDGIYFIQSGRGELSSQGHGDTRYRHVYLPAGSTFGQFALGRSGRQLTTIQAGDDGELLILTDPRSKALAQSNAPLANRL